jgi:hypothetical protein
VSRHGERETGADRRPPTCDRSESTNACPTPPTPGAWAVTKGELEQHRRPGRHTAGYAREHMRTLAGADGLILLRHSEYPTRMGTRDEHARTRADRLRRTHNPLVAGSSPARPTKRRLVRACTSDPRLAVGDGIVQTPLEETDSIRKWLESDPQPAVTGDDPYTRPLHRGLRRSSGLPQPDGDALALTSAT